MRISPISCVSGWSTLCYKLACVTTMRRGSKAKAKHTLINMKVVTGGKIGVLEFTSQVCEFDNDVYTVEGEGGSDRGGSSIVLSRASIAPSSGQ